MSIVRQLHKFGGSSLANPECYNRVANILKDHSGDNDLIVVSAAGSTTNRLIDWIAALDKDGRIAHEILQELRQFQLGLITDLLPEEFAKPLLDKTAAEFTALGELLAPIGYTERNRILGHGELWSSRLLAALLSSKTLPAIGLDSRHFLRADHGAQPEVDRAKSYPLLNAELSQHSHNRIVITGFMAQNESGETVLLGRNGSDYSATVIGALAEVTKVTIWSDVAGVYSADPRKVEDACLLPLLRLDEASELSRLAAPVLHSRTIQPVAQSSIDLLLRCSYTPDIGSTRVERVLASGRGAKIVTSLDDVSIVELRVQDGHDFERLQPECLALLTREQLLPLAYEAQSDTGCLRLAYTPEVSEGVMRVLKKSSIQAKSQLKEGFSLVAAVGAGVTNNANHCHGFYQQLKLAPTEFMFESENELSLVAVLRKTDTKRLINGIHKQLFQAQKRIGIVLCGHGNIGSSWAELFEQQKSDLEKRRGMSFDIITVADSQSHWLDLSGIHAKEITSKYNDEFVKGSFDWIEPVSQQQDYDEVVVIDVTASQILSDHYQLFANKGFHLISANKLAGSASSESYYAVQDAFSKTGRHWLYNATVGAGLPVNHTVRDLRESGDDIVALAGIFSGTLSWLFQQYDGAVPFSELVDLAWQQGLTEPDPRSDLDGTDVMRKLVILARESGLEIEPESVKVESLVSESVRDLSVDDFFEQVEELNSNLLERLEKAKREGKVLRYVARLSKEGATVGVEALDESHALANLLPCDNIFAIESKWYKDNPLVIRGPGAGKEVTAGAIQSDLNRLAGLL